MTRPGFRRTASGSSSRDAALGGSQPFSQAQILHLMRTEFGRARRYGHPVSLLLIAVDRLRHLVDIHGEELRRSALAALGQLVRDKTRGCDHLGLVDRDRYMLVLPHTGVDAAQIVGERIRGEFQGVEISVDGAPLALTLSCGLAGSDPEDSGLFDAVLERAEAALERAMVDGDTVRPFRPLPPST